MNTHYDIVIIGGGMVGASLAAALLPVVDELNLQIAVVEPMPMPTDDLSHYQPSYDARATALSYGTRRLYEQMGVWKAISAHVSAIQRIHVSDKGHFGATRLRAEEENVPALGYVVENHWMGRSLLNHITTHQYAERLTYCCPAEVKNVTPIEKGMLLDILMDGKLIQVSSDLVVVADGGRSELREKLGISYQQVIYEQHAVVANISPDRLHQNIAYERFTDTGPLALLPLQDQDGMARCGLVWTVPNEELEAVMALDDDVFLARIQERFGYRAGRFVHAGKRFSYPLKLELADEQVRPGLAVLGNAAHALHPIAGQGYNLALRGVVDLAQHIIEARRCCVSVGDISVLQAYHQARVTDQQRTIGLSDKTMKLFSNRNPALALGRDLGLQLMDVCPPIKTLFARAAMGLDVPAPRLK
ncbi:2-octaprenyl-6-methoxyphenyl hydroxylase [Neptunomonas sp.]|uniref:2-octaprenyl-6-methoxyphenyl hydroxylase n=1 Tax=Neptunomonas sp. TaxID=1971898 RepID=UPI0025F8EB90|nr:2-octaprenyl-6-methoxyphenyl hydroxylase [Neptunomonas sp.]